MARVLARDPDAEDRFLARMVCIPRFLRSLTRTLRTDEDRLEELSQETFRQLWAKLSQYRGEASLEAWAFGFARRAVRSDLRSAVARADHLPRDPVDLEDLAANDTAGGLPWSAAFEDVLEAFDGLPEAARELVRARAFEGARYEELEARLGESTSALRQRYHRALERLRATVRAARRQEERP